MIVDWWKGVCIVLAFSVVSYILMAIGGNNLSFEGIGKTVVSVMVVVGILAIGFLVERVYRRIR